MKPEVKVVLGSLFGDEGKGTTVQWLCKEAISRKKRPIVVRFSGGPQSAHTIYHNGVEHICSSFGAGVLLGIPTYYSYPESTFDPICLINELIVLNKKGINPVFDISNAPIITPYDVMYNRQSSSIIKDGTCGKGVYVSLQREKHFFFEDNPEEILSYCASWYNMKRDSDLDKAFVNCLNLVKRLNQKLNPLDFDVIIYEGTQGLLLDANVGLKPNVTATSTGLTNIKLDNAEVFLVTRTYLTRHGNGYNPLVSKEFDPTDETNVWNQYQGNFKTGALELDMLNYAFKIHNLKDIKSVNYNLAVTHIDTTLAEGKLSLIKGNTLVNTFVDTPDKAIQSITDNLDLQFNHIFYSEDKFSNFKIHK